jgi:flagellar protein FliL
VTALPTTEARGTEEATPAAPAKSRRKKVVVVALMVVLLAAAAWWFLRPKGPHEPEPGAIMPLDATQINLAGSHYLKIGLALQLTTDAEEVDGSKALDATIDLFSGKSLAQVSEPVQRRALKNRLTNELSEVYDGDVMGVYFTEFVTQ